MQNSAIPDTVPFPLMPPYRIEIGTFSQRQKDRESTLGPELNTEDNAVWTERSALRFSVISSSE